MVWEGPATPGLSFLPACNRRQPPLPRKRGFTSLRESNNGNIFSCRGRDHIRMKPHQSLTKTKTIFKPGFGEWRALVYLSPREKPKKPQKLKDVAYPNTFHVFQVGKVSGGCRGCLRLGSKAPCCRVAKPGLDFKARMWLQTPGCRSAFSDAFREGTSILSLFPLLS